jgi:hypothetical protein
MPSKRPSRRVRIAARIILALSQTVAWILCVAAVSNGTALGWGGALLCWFGAFGCLLVLYVLIAAPDTEAT